jgi:hypothetical protein
MVAMPTSTLYATDTIVAEMTTLSIFGSLTPTNLLLVAHLDIQM